MKFSMVLLEINLQRVHRKVTSKFILKNYMKWTKILFLKKFRVLKEEFSVKIVGNI